MPRQLAQHLQILDPDAFAFRFDERLIPVFLQQIAPVQLLGADQVLYVAVALPGCAAHIQKCIQIEVDPAVMQRVEAFGISDVAGVTPGLQAGLQRASQHRQSYIQLILGGFRRLIRE
ncbi:hypothetical protein D3C81_345150 [compost metagenome]